MSWEKKMPIIGSKLQAKLYRLGITQTQASEEMGFSCSYLCMCFKRGWMPETAVQSVENRFGIPYKEYAKNPLEKEITGFSDGQTMDLILEELRTIRSLLQELAKSNL